jgi:AcrR family transcriptional regulator
MGSGVNNNDPRVKRTRQLLLHAFEALAAEKEIRAISVQDITERATLNRATFYAHFRDKDALIEACMQSRIQEALATKLSSRSPFTKGNLRLLLCVVCDILMTTVRRCPRSHGESHPLIQATFQKELDAFLQDWLTQALPQGRRKKFAPETLATLLSWSLFGAAMEWYHNPTRLTQEGMATQVVDLLVEGVGNIIPIAAKE